MGSHEAKLNGVCDGCSRAGGRGEEVMKHHFLNHATKWIPGFAGKGFSTAKAEGNRINLSGIDANGSKN